MLSSHCFLCLPLLPPCTVPCRTVLAWTEQWLLSSCSVSWAMWHDEAHLSPCQTTATVLHLGGWPWSWRHSYWVPWGISSILADSLHHEGHLPCEHNPLVRFNVPAEVRFWHVALGASTCEIWGVNEGQWCPSILLGRVQQPDTKTPLSKTPNTLYTFQPSYFKAKPILCTFL